MKILLLGGGGFIGCHITQKLLQSTDHLVNCYDLFDARLQDSLGHSRFNYIHGDIRHDHTRVEKLIHDADVVVDLIAYANPSLYVSIPLDVFNLNFTENLKITEYCVTHQKRLIQFSTCEVYGKTVASLLQNQLPDHDNPAHAVFQEDNTAFILGPVNKHRWIYSCAKQLLERINHAYGLEDRLNYTIIRPFNFIGPRIDFLPSEQEGNPRVFSHFLDALKTGEPMKLINGGHQRRTYTYIDDAVDCIVRIVENPNQVCDKEIFNIGSPDNEISIRDLAFKMRCIYKRRWWRGQTELPEPIEVSGETFYGEGYDDSDRRIPDITKAQQLLGWQPRYNLDQTLEYSMGYWFNGEEGTSWIPQFT